jgi:ParB-like chromosome segregation protein Spo0J
MASLLDNVERVPINTISTHPQNARRGDVKAIAASLRANAQFAPIVVQARTRQVLSGNHTLLAARELGWEEIDAVFVDVDDQHAYRIMLAANRTAELGGYDNDALAELLSYLDSYEGTGYTVADIEALIAPPPTLDELADAATPGDDEWPVLRIRVPPHVRDDFHALTRDAGADDASTRFQYLLRLAHSACHREVDDEPKDRR